MRKPSPRVATMHYPTGSRVVIEQTDHFIEMTFDQAKALVKRLQKLIAEAEPKHTCQRCPRVIPKGEPLCRECERGES